jgi:nucleoside phosphorylase
MSQRKLDYDTYTVGWVCSLDCELNAARALLDEEDEPLDPAPNDDNLYLLGRIGNYNVVIAFPDVYGTTSIAQAVTNLVRTFPKIRFGLMVGVGGGAPHPDGDVRLGDVVVSEPKGSHGKSISTWPAMFPSAELISFFNPVL